MHKSFHALIALSICLSIIICDCSRKSAVAPDPYVDGPVTQAFDSLFSSMFAPDEPGAYVFVMHADTVCYARGFGLADLATREPITDSTVFNLSSSSKIFSTAALLKLEEQGLISLDDPLSKFFPEFPAEFFDKITIRNILTHSSGLPDLRPRDAEQWKNYLDKHSSMFSVDGDYRLYGTEKEHCRVFTDLVAVDYEPGTQYQRTDPSFMLIAPILERVTGQSFRKWMRDSIFNPLAITDAFYYVPGTRYPKMAHGYRRADSIPTKAYRSDDGKWEEYDYGEAEFFLTNADRGAFASPRDLMKWRPAFRNGRVVNDSTREKMYVPTIATGVPYASYGLGTAVRQRPGRPVKVYHMNSNGGFTVVEAAWPDVKVNYAVLSNRNDWDLRGVIDKVDSIFVAKGWI